MKTPIDVDVILRKHRKPSSCTSTFCSNKKAAHLHFLCFPTCVIESIFTISNKETMSSTSAPKSSLASDTTPNKGTTDTKPKMFDKEGAIGHQFTGKAGSSLIHPSV